MKTLLITLLTFIFMQTAFAYTETDRALLLYTERGDSQKVTQLLLADADPNVTNIETGFSALMASTFFYEPDITRRLLDAGADVNKRNKKNESALFYAIRNERPKTVIILLHYGADIQVKNDIGMTPLDIAIKMENAEIINLLQDSANSFTMNTMPDIPTQTSLTLVDELALYGMLDQLDDMDKKHLAKAEDKLSYHLTKKKIYQYNPSKFSLSLITPYSLAYYNYAVALQNEELPYESVIKDILASKDIVWLWAIPDPEKPIEKVTVRASGREYTSLAQTGYIPRRAFSQTQIPRDQLWPFPAAIFSDKNKVTEVLIYRPGKKIDIIKIKAKAFENYR